MISIIKINKYGTQTWSNTKGEYHRLDGPAVIWPHGSEEWWVDGKPHRLDGPAVIDSYGRQEWYVDGKRHRLDGPALIHADGSEEWWVNGKRHRQDGPAVIYANGSEEWFIRGNNITEKVNEWLNRNNKSYPFDLNTQILFKLTFGN